MIGVDCLKKFFVLVLVAVMALIAAGCDDLTGEDLLDQAIVNFEEAKSYKAEADMTTSVMGMSIPSEIEMIFEAPENFYSKITMKQMGQTMEIEMLMLDGEMKVFSDDPMTKTMLEMMSEEMFSQMDVQQYQDFFLKKTTVEKVENPEGFGRGYETFHVITDSDVIMDLIREEVKNMQSQIDDMIGVFNDDLFLEEDENLEMPSSEEMEKMMENLMDSMKIDIESFVIVDTSLEEIVQFNMTMVQIFDMTALLGELDEMDELEEGLFPLEMETVIEMEMRYKDYNQPVDFPSI